MLVMPRFWRKERIPEGEQKGLYCLGCGILRLIPNAVEGGYFTLVPCPRCGRACRGRLLQSQVEVFS